jgi:hypothetical protein
MLKTSDIKITFLGVIPQLIDSTGTLTPEQIAAFSALLTFKGKSVKQLATQALEKGQNLDKKAQAILRKSSLRGHASIATTPTLALTFEGSKFLDLMLTGLVFASGLMASGRRTETTTDDVVYPTKIYKNKTAKKLYTQVAKKNIDFLNWLLAKGVAKDQARKIQQYGIYGTGTITLPVESIISFAKEFKGEGEEWMPEEGKFFLEKIYHQASQLGIDYLLKTRMLAPKDPYPYPNTFKNQKTTNIARDLRRSYHVKYGLSRLVSLEFLKSVEFKRRLRILEKALKKMTDYTKALEIRRQLVRDFNSAVRAVFLTRGSWCVWTEKKRHRTAFMVADSIYYGADKAGSFFAKNKKAILAGKIGKRLVTQADWYVALPPQIKNNREYLTRWLNSCLVLLETYQQLLRLGIPHSEAVFILPRGLKFDMVAEYNLYNLISGYLPLRLCTTADEQIQSLAYQEALQLTKVLKKQKLGMLAKHIVPKCHTIGWCPEENFCGKIKIFNKKYNQALHEKYHKELEEKLLKE